LIAFGENCPTPGFLLAALAYRWPQVSSTARLQKCSEWDWSGFTGWS
jgi:hypothetical protein